MAARMRERCAFGTDERDMIVLQHEFVIEAATGARRVYSTLIDFGIPGGDSAMARTVSLPVAIATRLILQGEVTERGVDRPDPARRLQPDPRRARASGYPLQGDDGDGLSRHSEEVFV